MGKPSDPAEHGLRIPEHHESFSREPLPDPLRQSPDLQEVSGPDACGCGREGVSDNIDLLGSRSDPCPAFFIRREQFGHFADLP